MATYAVSDLHGQYGIFDKLLERIGFSEDDFMYVLGDAIDRGPDGVRILQRIMNAPNMDLLIGKSLQDRDADDAQSVKKQMMSDERQVEMSEELSAEVDVKGHSVGSFVDVIGKDVVIPV